MSETIAEEQIGSAGPLTVTINWSAIVAGWLVATAIAWLFYVLGLAVGFSAVDLSNANAPGPQTGWGVGTRVWLFATWAVSLFLGGMFASWFDGKTDQTVGTLHAIAVWALATTVTALLVGLGSAGVLQGGASLVRGVASGVAGGVGAGVSKSGGAGANDATLGVLQGTIRQSLSQAAAKNRAAGGASQPAAAPASDGATAAPAASSPSSASSGQGSGASPSQPIDREAASAIATDLVAGNGDRAKARIMAETGMSSADVDPVMQSLKAQADQAKAELKQAADRTAHYVSSALWAAFVSSAIGLIAAAFGGWLGAGHVHHVYDRGYGVAGWHGTRRSMDQR